MNSKKGEYWDWERRCCPEIGEWQDQVRMGLHISNITSTLLTTGESIISDERLAWQPLNIGLGNVNEAETEGQKQTAQHTIDMETEGHGGNRGSNRVHPG